MDNMGDVCSFTSVYSDESVDEITDYLQKRKAYVGTDGKFIFSTSIDTVDFVLHNLTGW